MASTKGYLDFVVEQLSELDEITFRAMMGEYILYYRGKVFGGIYDDRLLVKPVPAAVRMVPDAPKELPYEGAKEMLLVDDIDNREFLCILVESMWAELPEGKNEPWHLVGDVSIWNGKIGMAICHEYQNRHVGRTVINAAVNRAAQVGWDKLEAEIYSFNRQSQKAFTSAGFEKISDELYAYTITENQESKMAY